MTAPRRPRLIQLASIDPAAACAELYAGLAATPASTSPKFLYDALGSKLFEAITELPEYYPTRVEAGIFAAHAEAMARHLPAGAALVDLGAGNCAKAARLFSNFRPSRYLAVDISVEFLGGALECLQRQFPDMDMTGIGMDFSSTLALPPAAGDGPFTLFYPGSSIGNFTPREAERFLAQARAASAGGSLVIGVDLVKPVQVLEPAYDDPLGVTAAFNRNLLLHFNRLAGTDFRLTDWSHRANFNAKDSRIEMHLVATRDTVVRWPSGERAFAAGETIHTENSYKWRLDDFGALLSRAGLRDIRHWTDAQAWFAVFVARA